MGRLCLPLLIVLSAYHPLFAQETSASGSCGKPRNQIEYRVCKSPYATLKAIDKETDTWYRRAVKASDDKEALRLEQQEWIRSLDSCLTSESIEPSPYVCDSVRDPAKKDVCFRDFCLVRRYHERSQVLHRLATYHLPRRYLMSSEWPSGIHESMQPMEEMDRPLCWAVNSYLARREELVGPLNPDSKFKLPPPWPQVASYAISSPDILPLAQRLELALRQRHQHPTELVFRNTFSDLLSSRISSGELAISVYPYRSKDSEDRVIRYQRWARSTDTTSYDTYSPVEFFYSPDSKLDKLVPIQFGHDVFIFRDELFIAWSAERTYDNAWQRLPIPQPVLYIFKIAMEPPDKAYAVPACHFVYSGPL